MRVSSARARQQPGPPFRAEGAAARQPVGGRPLRHLDQRPAGRAARRPPGRPPAATRSACAATPSAASMIEPRCGTAARRRQPAQPGQRLPHVLEGGAGPTPPERGLGPGLAGEHDHLVVGGVGLAQLGQPPVDRVEPAPPGGDQQPDRGQPGGHRGRHRLPGQLGRGRRGVPVARAGTGRRPGPPAGPARTRSRWCRWRRPGGPRRRAGRRPRAAGRRRAARCRRRSRRAAPRRGCRPAGPARWPRRAAAGPAPGGRRTRRTRPA